MKPLDFLRTAELLLQSGKGRPTAASLRRSLSSAYYALFHCLAREGADLMIGGSGADRSKAAWIQVYRALEHGHAKGRCKEKATVSKFPKGIEDFADTFVTMQEKRHAADFDPSTQFSKSQVRSDIATVRQVISDFGRAPAKDRRAFCAFVLLKTR